MPAYRVLYVARPRYGDSQVRVTHETEAVRGNMTIQGLGANPRLSDLAIGLTFRQPEVPQGIQQIWS